MPRSAAQPRRIVNLAFLLLIAVLPTAVNAARTDVYLLGTLYNRHGSVPAYDLKALRKIVLAIDPEVIVVDCTPTEVRERKVHESKVEYPAVIFPLAKQRGYLLYPAEPDEPLFSRIVVPIADARERFARTQPERTRALEELEEATFAALRLYWRSPSEVHDATTAAVLSGRKMLDASMYGEIQKRADHQWIDHWAAAIRSAVAANPGRRILATAGLDNRAQIEVLLRRDPNINVIDMVQWLRAAH